MVWERAEDFERGIEEVEVMLALRPPRGHWDRAGRLRLIQMPGAGVDSLLPDPDLPEQVRVANCRGIHEPEMAEFTLALLLAVAKRIPRAAAQQAGRVPTRHAGRTTSRAALVSSRAAQDEAPVTAPSLAEETSRAYLAKTPPA